MSRPQLKEFTTSDTVLVHGQHPTLQYKPMGAQTANLHLGQMKLCVADEMAIALGLVHICSKAGYAYLDKIKRRDAHVAVVVAGGAPGDHFCALSETFPFVDFHLYDERAWNHDLVTGARQSDSTKPITLHQELFLLSTAKQWAMQSTYDHVIFLSDLRTQGVQDGNYTAIVEKDMQLQWQLTSVVNAAYSVLKFRLPYESKTRKYKYLDGIIEFEAFPPRNSTEARLHVTDTTSSKIYDPIMYANEMFYHNQITRNGLKCLFTTTVCATPMSYDNAFCMFTQKFVCDLLGIDVLNHVARFDHSKFRAQPQTDAHHHSLLALLMQLEHTCIDTHIPDRIKRPGLPRVHPRPGWL